MIPRTVLKSGTCLQSLVPWWEAAGCGRAEKATLNKSAGLPSPFHALMLGEEGGVWQYSDFELNLDYEIKRSLVVLGLVPFPAVTQLAVCSVGIVEFGKHFQSSE